MQNSEESTRGHGPHQPGSTADRPYDAQSWKSYSIGSSSTDPPAMIRQRRQEWKRKDKDKGKEEGDKKGRKEERRGNPNQKGRPYNNQRDKSTGHTSSSAVGQRAQPSFSFPHLVWRCPATHCRIMALFRQRIQMPSCSALFSKLCNPEGNAKW